MRTGGLLLLICLCLLFTGAQSAWSHNPFTSRPEIQHQAPEPLFKSKIFVKIIVWQNQLKQEMSELIRTAKNEGRIGPLLVLFGIAFLYGLIHAAGPGHGKVVAMSYVLSHRASIPGGVLFGTSFALIHALSGVVGVLGLRAIIQSSVSDTLTSATNATQIISFTLITLLGLWILVKHVKSFFLTPANKNGAHDAHTHGSGKGVLPWAAAVGLVPCPAVVMVMLFCLTMDLLLLGFLLALLISAGMATTISGVVIATLLGKRGLLKTLPSHYAASIERVVGVLSGSAIMILGVLFLMAAINTTFY